MATILNNFNTVILQGKVTHLISDKDKYDNVMKKFYLKTPDVSIAVNVKGSMAATVTLTEDSTVTVYGNLRFSRQSKCFKVEASRIINNGMATLDNPVNYILLEGIVREGMLIEFGKLMANFESINLSRPDADGASQTYQLVIPVLFTRGKASKAGQVIEVGGPLYLEGCLSGPKIHIVGVHIKSASKILR